jgi:hypothetical protein
MLLRSVGAKLGDVSNKNIDGVAPRARPPQLRGRWLLSSVIANASLTLHQAKRTALR